MGVLRGGGGGGGGLVPSLFWIGFNKVHRYTIACTQVQLVSLHLIASSYITADDHDCFVIVRKTASILLENLA